MPIDLLWTYVCRCGLLIESIGGILWKSLLCLSRRVLPARRLLLIARLFQPRTSKIGSSSSLTRLSILIYRGDESAESASHNQTPMDMEHPVCHVIRGYQSGHVSSVSNQIHFLEEPPIASDSVEVKCSITVTFKTSSHLVISDLCQASGTSWRSLQ